jgi:dTDP-4-dehydrorhamnose 3,5-epimerase-like enzyme
MILHMGENQSDLWRGLGPLARKALATRDYNAGDMQAKLHSGRAEAREVVGDALPAGLRIPGVEVFHRRVFHQRYRGHFAEFAREGEGAAGKIGMWPRQWATALMFAGTSKGFHIHPPHIPEGTTPEAWFQRLFVTEPQHHALRPYDLEQWDMMFFIQGQAEMFLCDERAGMPRKKMRFIIEGDDTPGPNNVGVIIPAGVAHAIRCVSSKDLIMVYGTSTTFAPENEGRIAHALETPTTPADWEAYWNLA